MLFLATIFALTAGVGSLKIPRFAPPDFPPSTRENDGTLVGRYDVRRTMAWQEPGTTNLNSYFFLLWLTTTDGSKYHVTLAPNFRLNFTTGIFVLNDLQNLTAPAAAGTAFIPGQGRSDAVSLISSIQNFTSPVGGDNYTDLFYNCDFAGVKVDVHFSPTGKNLYVGGAGGVTIAPNQDSGDDYRRLIPGYSWYWGNPTLRVDGTVWVEGEPKQINYNESFAFLERQTGMFGIPGGHLGFWLYLSNGLMVHCWSLSPTSEGTLRPGKPAWATVWHPNGLHEVVAVDNTTRGSDPYVSEITGLTYFRSFDLNLSTRNASLQIKQVARLSEATPFGSLPGYNISEAYGQGTGVWDGEEVTFFGHVEQLSFLGR